MPTKPTLSKSQYTTGQRCPLALWFSWNRRDLKRAFNNAANSGRNARLQMGNEVGDMARYYFSKTPAIIRATPFETEKGAQQTKDLIAAGETVIAEAIAIHPTSGGHCRADLLRKVPGTKDEWDLVEVKSTASVKPYHIEDLAFQYYVFKGAGYKIRSASLMTIDNAYVRQGAVDVKKLFKLQDMTKEIIAKQPDIESVALGMIKMRDNKTPPKVDIGGKCDTPFVCDYKAHCWQNVPKLSVFNVVAAPEAEKLVKKIGTYDVKDIPDSLVPHTIKAVDISCAKSGQEHVDQGKIKTFLGKMEYPLYYLDYETILPTVPLYDGTRPYQQVPFQFSLHVQQKPGGPLVHHEFLHKSKTDPREAFIKKLLQVCGKKGSVIVYYKGFEAKRNEELARDFPHYADKLKALNARMVDLLEPFKNRWLYSPTQNGSASIKDVLPAFTGLSYTGMAVANGEQAMTRYADYVRGTMDAVKDLKKFWNDMLVYCSQDTMAMVKLKEVLEKKVAQPAARSTKKIKP